MKVTTDACIQGAWTPVDSNVRRVLDIGTGTGLLALMLAQRSGDVTIDAIELDKDAAAQAGENVAASPWGRRVAVIQADACAYTGAERYDMIVSNPPFFHNSLLSDKEQKNMARHTGALSYEELLAAIDRNLAAEGYCSVLLPYTEYEAWKTLATEKGWHETGRLHVRHRPGAEVKRVVGLYARQAQPLTQEELVIQDEAGNYTGGFTTLLSPYYLNLQAAASSGS